MKVIYSDELGPRRRRPWAIIIGLDDEAARERGFWEWPVRVLDPKRGRASYTRSRWAECPRKKGGNPQ